MPLNSGDLFELPDRADFRPTSGLESANHLSPLHTAMPLIPSSSQKRNLGATSSPTGQQQPPHAGTVVQGPGAMTWDREYSNSNGSRGNDSMDPTLTEEGDLDTNTNIDEVISRLGGAAAKQTLVNEQLRDEVDNLRQTLERLQAEGARHRSTHIANNLDIFRDPDHPPSYDNIN